MSKIHIRAFKNIAHQATEIFIRNDEGEHAILTWEKPAQIGIPTPHVALIEDMDAQRLMDDLWTSGFRPTEGSGSAGAMGAVQEHLKDLRRIVFKDYTK